jgi:hypothetical protein
VVRLRVIYHYYIVHGLTVGGWYTLYLDAAYSWPGVAPSVMVPFEPIYFTGLLANHKPSDYCEITCTKASRTLPIVLMHLLEIILEGLANLDLSFLSLTKRAAQIDP